MVEVGARVGDGGPGGVDGPEVGEVALLLDLELAARAEQGAVPRDARRVARVHGVDAEGDDGHRRFWIGDPVRKKRKSEVDALGVITISRKCFERCCSNKKIPPYHSDRSLVTLRNQRPTLLRAPAYRAPSEASPRRRCGHASRFLWH